MFFKLANRTRARPTPLLRKVVEGMIQSAFLYSAASVVLVVTIFASAHVAYVACLNVFPALSVRPSILWPHVPADDNI